MTDKHIEDDVQAASIEDAEPVPELEQIRSRLQSLINQEPVAWAVYAPYDEDVVLRNDEGDRVDILVVFDAQRANDLATAHIDADDAQTRPLEVAPLVALRAHPVAHSDPWSSPVLQYLLVLGELSDASDQDSVSEIVSRAEAIWWSLTAGDQDRLERLLSSLKPRHVSPGSWPRHVSPRSK